MERTRNQKCTKKKKMRRLTCLVGTLLMLAPCELCGCLRSAQRVLCEGRPAHQVLVFRSLLLRQLISCTRLCVPDSRHGMHHGSRKSHVSIFSRTKRKMNKIREVGAQTLDAEAQTVCPVSSRCGRRGTVLRVAR